MNESLCVQKLRRRNPEDRTMDPNQPNDHEDMEFEQLLQEQMNLVQKMTDSVRINCSDIKIIIL